MPSLDRIAREVLVENGFQPDAGEAVEREIAGLRNAPVTGDGVKDLRALRWSSIDNTSSRDLDQIEVAEEKDGGIVLRIGIADVDSLVPKGSAIDAHAEANATSVYTGVTVYPMLPERLSTDLTSLNEDAERLVLVIEVELASDGAVRRHDVYRALATNHAKLAYESVGPWLEGHGPEPEKLVPDDALEAQLWLQDRAASLLKRVREEAGALEFDTIEATAVAKDGKVESIAVTRKNRARDLIEDFMIAANIAIAQILAERGRSAIRRVVRVPRRWDRIVEVARQYGFTLPERPDARALAAFLGQRRAADPMRFPELSLTIV
jgi:exoribonuclease-2